MDLRSLPEELVTRILSYSFGNTSKIFSEKKLPHVNVSRYTEEALKFAAKPGNAELLCKTLQGRLILGRETLLSQDLFDNLAPHLEELIVEGCSEEFVFCTTSKCKKLKRLELKEFPSEFDWSTIPDGLKGIHVTIDSTGQMRLIGDALGRLQLQELGIRYNCAVSADDVNIHNEVKQVCSKLSHSLKHLRKISIENGEHRNTSTWDVIENFKAVDHIVITEPLTRKARKLLQSQRSLTIITPMIDVDTFLANRVTTIDVTQISNEDSLKAGDIAKLSCFQKLTVFRAKVLAEAETFLHMLPKDIREVELHFVPGSKLQPEHPGHSIKCSVRMTAGSISRFLDGARLLSGLCLYGAAIEEKEMKEALERLGEKLLKFGVTLDAQDRPLLFTEEVLNLMAERNCSLKELSMKCDVFEEWEQLGVFEKIWVEQERLQHLENCLMKFHRSVPGAQILYLISLLRRLIRARI